MERPDKLSGKQGEYIKYLEEKLEVFSSKKTAIRAYLALKQIIDDTTTLVHEGISIKDPTSGDIENYPIISDMSLTNKDDKSFDRIFKVVDKLESYGSQLMSMEDKFTPEEIDTEKEIMKGEGSVESRIFNSKNG